MGLFSKKAQGHHPARIPYQPAGPDACGGTETIPEPLVAHDEEQVEGMWEKCPECGSVIYTDDLIANLNVCTSCNYHFRLSARQRIMYTADEGTFEESNENLIGTNPLDFPGTTVRFARSAAIPMKKEAVITGKCRIGGEPAVIAVMDGFL